MSLQQLSQSAPFYEARRLAIQAKKVKGSSVEKPYQRKRLPQLA
jgi:hypothetical protein